MSMEQVHQFPSYDDRAADRQSLAKLGDEIVKLAGHLNAANYRFLTLIAEWDRRKGWGGDGATASCAHWLSWKCGLDMGAAREKVRTANALAKLPKIAAAMERGELSYAKVRALTRVACPNTEDTLLMYALHGTAVHVERIVRDFRRCKEAEELGREAQQQIDRKLTWFHDEDGMLVIKRGCPPKPVRCSSRPSKRPPKSSRLLMTFPRKRRPTNGASIPHPARSMR